MENQRMVKYDRLTWSHGYNAERHPRNEGGDGLAFYCWQGDAPDDLENVADDGDIEENGGELVGWVYVSLSGRVFARFGDEDTEMAGGNLGAAFQWVERKNELSDPEGESR